MRMIYLESVNKKMATVMRIKVCYFAHLEIKIMKKGEYGGFVVDIDLEQSEKKSIGYREDRDPKLFSGLAE